MSRPLRFIFSVLPLALLALSPARASETGNLQSLQRKLDEQKRMQQVLAEKVSDARTDMEDTQNALVRSAASIQSNEQALSALDAKIAALDKDEKALSEKLEKDFGSISNLVLALERIRRVPPESLIARPGAPLRAAQSAMLLRDVLPAVNARAASLQASLDRLSELRRTLEDSKAEATEKGESLKKEYAAQQKLADRRADLFRQTSSDYEDTRRAVATISSQARSLRDLIARLEENERETQKSRPKKAEPMPGTGIPGLPSPGPVLTAFGEKDSIGAVSQGISVRTPPGSTVVAPMGGVVKFSGTFRNYGHMVIIAHAGGYHSLIGGLDKTTVEVGQGVKSGEPLGNMPAGSSSQDYGTLYYELRHNGKPVNPAEKLKELRS